MAVIQFTGKLDTGWTKAIQPKGSRLIAYITGRNRFNPELPAYTAVFQDRKKPRKLTMFEVMEGREPQEVNVDKPIAAFKDFVDWSNGKIELTAPKEEILALLSEVSLAQEESEKKREILRLPGRLRAINDELNYISEWNKCEKVVGNEERLNLIYYLSSIASTCTCITQNIAADLCNGDAEETPTAEAAEM